MKIDIVIICVILHRSFSQFAGNKLCKICKASALRLPPSSGVQIAKVRLMPLAEIIETF
jgi:hypothetical protein